MLELCDGHWHLERRRSLGLAYTLRRREGSDRRSPRRFMKPTVMFRDRPTGPGSGTSGRVSSLNAADLALSTPDFFANAYCVHRCSF